MDNLKNGKAPVALLKDRQILPLTQEQAWAASLWDKKDKEEIASAIGVPPEILTEWENQPLFIAEIADLSAEFEAEIEEKQAAALVFDNSSYAAAEATIGLEEGTIMEWAQEEESLFNELLDQMKREVANQIKKDPNPEGLKNPDPEDLNEDQIRAIPLIIEGKTDAQVGEAIGKSRETINRWRNQNKDFIKELKKAREAYLDSQIMALSATARKAITVLENLLDSEDEKIRTRVAIHLLRATALPQRIK